MSVMDGVKGWVRQNGSPVTAGLIGSLFVAALLNWFLKMPEIFALGGDSLSRPWSFLTYPWAYSPLTNSLSMVCFFFMLMWLFSVGPGLEREMGSGRFAAFWAAFTVVPGILMWLVGGFGLYGGPFIPEAAITIAWCFRNRGQSINLYGILPVPAPWLAAITAFGTLMVHGSQNPLFGVAATAPLALAMLFAQDRLPIAFGGGRGRSGFGGFGGARVKTKVHANRAQAQYDEAYYDDVLRREKERDERERLRKLFESSLKDDK